MGNFEMNILLLMICACARAAEEGTAPVITEQPSDVTVIRNEPAVLNCASSGATLITWFHDGEQVKTSPSSPLSHMVILPTGSLFFLRVTTGRRDSDVGTYWCVVSNSYGVTRSRNVTLRVASLSETFQLKPQSVVKVKIGESITLPCRPPKGWPVPKVRWLKNGWEVANSSDITLTLNGDLIINQTIPEDSGIYNCVAQNIAGSRESPPTKLFIMKPPWFQESPTSITTSSGITVEFTCIANGFPEPAITWNKIAGKMPFGRTKVEENKLIIEYATTADSGVYMCEATSEAGTLSSNATLTVVDAPVFVERPQVIQAKSGSRVELVCRVNGNPNPLLMWRLPTQDKSALLIPSETNGHAYVSESGERLVIENSAMQDSGVYYCWGISGGGGVSAHAKVMVVDAYPPPVIGVGPKDMTVPPGGVVSFPCEVVSEAATPIVSWWFRLDEHQLPQQILEGNSYPRISITVNGVLILKDVRNSDSGIYICKVIADTGNIEQEATLHVDKDALDIAPVNLPAPPSKPEVTAVNETSVHLRWLPNSQVSSDSKFWYSVEYWRNGWSEWRVAAAIVRQETCVINSLDPGNAYTFFVRAVTDQGESFPSPWSDPIISQSTGDSTLSVDQVHFARRRLSRPTVALIDAKTTGPSGVLLMWKFLTSQEAVEGVLVFTVSAEGIVTVATVLGSSSSSHHLDNLQPNTNHTFFIVPFWRSIEGTPSNSLSLFTPEDVPMVPPNNVHVALYEDGSALITWSTLSTIEARGKIIGYQVTLTHNGTQLVEAALDPWLEVHNLVPSRLYTVRVAAQTGAGLGPFSDPVLMDFGSSKQIQNESSLCRLGTMIQYFMFLFNLCG